MPFPHFPFLLFISTHVRTYVHAIAQRNVHVRTYNLCDVTGLAGLAGFVTIDIV